MHYYDSTKEWGTEDEDHDDRAQPDHVFHFLVVHSSRSDHSKTPRSDLPPQLQLPRKLESPQLQLRAPRLEFRGSGFLYCYHVGVLEYVLDSFHMSVPVNSVPTTVAVTSVPKEVTVPVTLRVTSGASFPVLIWAANGERPVRWMLRDWPATFEWFRKRPLMLGSVLGAKQFLIHLWESVLEENAFESLNWAAERAEAGVCSGKSLEGRGCSCFTGGQGCSSGGDVVEDKVNFVRGDKVVPNASGRKSCRGVVEDYKQAVPNPDACKLEITLATSDFRLVTKSRFSSNKDLVDTMIASMHVPGIFKGLTRVEGIGVCWDGGLAPTLHSRTKPT